MLFAGVFGVLTAALFWGSNYIVTKQHDMGDGMTFQFLQCTGILLVGVMTLVFSLDVPRSPDYEKFPMPDKYALISSEGILGGVVWCLGNLMTIPIVRRVGIGLGLSLWNGTATVVSFAMSRASIIGLKPQTLHPLWAGYFGAFLGVLSLVVFAFIDADGNEEADANVDAASGHQRICTASGDVDCEADCHANGNGDASSYARIENNEQESSRRASAGSSGTDASTPLLEPIPSEIEERVVAMYENLLQTVEDATHGHPEVASDKEARARFEGIVMCLLAGTLYGIQFVPLTVHSMQYPKPENLSDVIYQMRFTFSQFLGIYVTSALAFFLYCFVRKNRPVILAKEAFAPSIVSGMMWGIACMGSMVAVSDMGLGIG
ncbi:Transmembrane protein 144 [Hondaea fermentalgiana]|uniref:Transmembrane protein 144 n=1 Tax=Hondaea fermentalgiana TaxID=2315210 RepID=A0A2R5FZA1_9STRA|nr:Transmembrane protein 144 [Hondaea fermentalgiana]|eukprot:GBG24077.1 Transmembrane protein 144 [Hondaea fermentalgiana]